MRVAHLGTRSSRQGAGNSIFTLMKYNENPELTVYATDYSYQAVEVVKVGQTPCSGSGRVRLTADERDVPRPSTRKGQDQRSGLGYHVEAARSPLFA